MPMDNLVPRCVEDVAVARALLEKERRELRGDRRLCPCPSQKLHLFIVV
jgi:hypothetical protein